MSTTQTSAKRLREIADFICFRHPDSARDLRRIADEIEQRDDLLVECEKALRSAHAHYGGGIAVEYAQGVDAEVHNCLRAILAARGWGSDKTAGAAGETADAWISPDKIDKPGYYWYAAPYMGVAPEPLLVGLVRPDNVYRSMKDGRNCTALSGMWKFIPIPQAPAPLYQEFPVGVAAQITQTGSVVKRLDIPEVAAPDGEKAEAPARERPVVNDPRAVEAVVKAAEAVERAAEAVEQKSELTLDDVCQHECEQDGGWIQTVTVEADGTRTVRLPASDNESALEFVIIGKNCPNMECTKFGTFRVSGCCFWSDGVYYSQWQVTRWRPVPPEFVADERLVVETWPSTHAAASAENLKHLKRITTLESDRDELLRLLRKFAASVESGYLVPANFACQDCADRFVKEARAAIERHKKGGA